MSFLVVQEVSTDKEVLTIWDSKIEALQISSLSLKEKLVVRFCRNMYGVSLHSKKFDAPIFTEPFIPMKNLKKLKEYLIESYGEREIFNKIEV